MSGEAFKDALADFVEAVLRIGPERARDLIREHEDEIAEAMDQDTDSREIVLLGQLSAALLTLEGWQDEGAGRVVLIADLDRAFSAHFQWRGDAPASPAYRAAIRNAVDTLCGVKHETKDASS